MFVKTLVVKTFECTLLNGVQKCYWHGSFVDNPSSKGGYVYGSGDIDQAILSPSFIAAVEYMGNS